MPTQLTVFDIYQVLDHVAAGTTTTDDAVQLARILWRESFSHLAQYAAGAWLTQNEDDTNVNRTRGWYLDRSNASLAEQFQALFSDDGAVVPPAAGMTKSEFTKHLKALAAMIHGTQNRGVRAIQIALLQELIASAQTILAEVLDD